jgi:hypothetical protein
MQLVSAVQDGRRIHPAILQEGSLQL